MFVSVCVRTCLCMCTLLVVLIGIYTNPYIVKAKHYRFLYYTRQLLSHKPTSICQAILPFISQANKKKKPD